MSSIAGTQAAVLTPTDGDLALPATPPRTY